MSFDGCMWRTCSEKRSSVSSGFPKGAEIHQRTRFNSSTHLAATRLRLAGEKRWQQRKRGRMNVRFYIVNAIELTSAVKRPNGE